MKTMKKIIINYTIEKKAGNLIDYPVNFRSNNHVWENPQNKVDTIKEYQGQRSFSTDKEAENFLQRLSDFKLKLALRCAGQSFTKKSDLFKPEKQYGYKTPYKNYEYKDKAEQAIKANVYKLKLNIQTINL